MGRSFGYRGVIDSAVFQRTLDYLEDFAPGYHVMQEDVTMPGFFPRLRQFQNDIGLILRHGLEAKICTSG